jgi:hypothetical protein
MAGPSFAVQVKSNDKEITYSKPYERRWIETQENPFFICVVHRKLFSMDIYSTWNRINGFLQKGAEVIILSPGEPQRKENLIEYTSDGHQRIWLGKPVARLTVADALDDEKITNASQLLKLWINVDRANIVNQQANMYWTRGPQHYETDEFPTQVVKQFFFNPNNFDATRRNYVENAAALRKIIDHYRQVHGSLPCQQEHIDTLDLVLKQHVDLLRKNGLWRGIVNEFLPAILADDGLE